jgi:hypothetical protein|nr:MAG TPA: hypothetical protein [Caudoviricetes sp.]
MAKMSVYKVDGVALPPVIRGNAKYSENDLAEEAYRDALGFTHKKTVRFGVRKIELSWPRLTDDELNLIADLTKGKEYFKFEYYDRKKKAAGVIQEAYSGNTLKYTIDKGATNKKVWKDISISIVER